VVRLAKHHNRCFSRMRNSLIPARKKYIPFFLPPLNHSSTFILPSSLFFYPYLHIQKNTTCCDFHILCFLTEVYASCTLFITHFMCSNRVVGIAQYFLIFFAVFTNALACVSVLDILTLHSYSSNFLFLFLLLLTPPQFNFRHFGLFPRTGARSTHLLCAAGVW
jgi:hypothetical protein